MDKNVVNFGVDLGSYFVKNSNSVKFESRVEDVVDDVAMFLNAGVIEINGRKFLLEDGYFDIINSKLDKSEVHILANLYNSLALSVPNFSTVNLAVGLPINQFHSKDKLKQLILENKDVQFKKDGKKYNYTIEDVTVLPEGMGVFYSLDIALLKEVCNKNILIVDIGGKTTDICLLEAFNGARRIKDKSTCKVGTLDIYRDAIKKMNREDMSLNISTEDIHSIVVNGQYTGGIDMSFMNSIYKQYTQLIFNDIRTTYDYKRCIVFLVVLLVGAEPFKDSISSLYISFKVSFIKALLLECIQMKSYKALSSSVSLNDNTTLAINLFHDV